MTLQSSKYRLIVQENAPGTTKTQVVQPDYPSFPSAKSDAMLITHNGSLRFQVRVQRVDTGEIVALFQGNNLSDFEAIDASAIKH